jgi:transposase-like protein
MSYSNTKLLSALLNNESVDEVFRLELEAATNEILTTELTAFLNYEKYSVDGYNSGNSRNGYYERTIHSRFGDLNIRIPRDRNGEFSQQTVPAYQRNTDSLETTVIQLYKKGITTREIADLIEKMYGHHYSPATVSNITKAVQEQVTAFHQRPISPKYAIVYGDATYLSVRRDSVSKEALHILIGITHEGEKEVLDYSLYPSESADNYREMLLSLQLRGLQQVLLFVTDGLNGFRNACLEVYPKAKHQSCWTHVARNVMKHVRAKDKSKVMDDLKPVYKAETMEKAEEHLLTFMEKYMVVYPKAVKVLTDNNSLFTFYNFPQQIRISIYTTNLIEGFNKNLKRGTKRKEQFPNEDSLERYVCSFCSDYNQRFGTRIHKGFAQASAELNELFD